MTSPSLTDPSAPVPGRARRTEVLALLRRADRPLSAAEVSEAMTLHVNTARFHLDGLVEDGLAERTTQPRDTPGRPRILYASEGPTIGPRSYELLAEMLTGFVSSLPGPGRAPSPSASPGGGTSSSAGRRRSAWTRPNRWPG